MGKIALTGLLLGWSIAWPPGPINAEMIRRGLARGFWSAWAVGLGACSADFLWAMGVALASGQIARNPTLEKILGVVSIVLLLFLATTFLRGAWSGWKAHRAGTSLPEPKRLQGASGGWLLGFTLAMTSPWNLAFWLAVFGQQSEALSFAASLVLACGVITGACLWGMVLCVAVRWGARFATPMWQVTTQGLTGLLMVYFAGSALCRLYAP
ncbi:MAG: LysE family transporter [Planctomycetota bacterium]